MKLFSTTILSMLAMLTSALAIEKPEYDMVKQSDGVELRRYKTLHIVTTSMEGNSGRNSSFRKLAGYIGKQNEKEQKIAMTAPVIMSPAEPTKTQSSAQAPMPKRMSFIVPQAVVDAGIPKPSNASVNLESIPGGLVVAVRYKGSYKQKSRDEAVAKLNAWIAKNNLRAISEPSFAMYNPPWIPEFFRRNEVWIRVQNAQ